MTKQSHLRARTECLGTETLHGFVPHLPLDGLLLPVKLVFPRDDKYKPHEALMQNGRFVYALPGGGEYIPE